MSGLADPEMHELNRQADLNEPLDDAVLHSSNMKAAQAPSMRSLQNQKGHVSIVGVFKLK